jgi:hypothetical protein
VSGHIFKRKHEVRILLIQQIKQIKFISIIKFGFLSSRKGSRYKSPTAVDCNRFLKATASLSHFLRRFERFWPVGIVAIRNDAPGLIPRSAGPLRRGSCPEPETKHIPQSPIAADLLFLCSIGKSPQSPRGRSANDREGPTIRKPSALALTIRNDHGGRRGAEFEPYFKQESKHQVPFGNFMTGDTLGYILDHREHITRVRRHITSYHPTPGKVEEISGFIELWTIDYPLESLAPTR